MGVRFDEEPERIVGWWSALASTQLGVDCLVEVAFEEVVVPASRPRPAEPSLAWLPRAELRLWRESGGGWALDDRWLTGEATTRTLELLWKAGGRPRLAPMVLLAGALRDLDRVPADAWPPATLELARAGYRRLEAALVAHGVGAWHGAGGAALPCTFANAAPVVRAWKPADEDGLLLAAGLSVAMTFSTWAPVALLRSP